MSLFPTEEEQIAYIDTAESVNNTPSAFSAFILQDDIDHILRTGGNADEARMKIAAEFSKQKPIEDRAAFLKNLYYGGNGLITENGRFSAWYGDDGIHIAKGDAAQHLRSAQLIRWTDAAERIDELLDSGTFATNLEVTEAPRYERLSIAVAVWNLYHDFSDEAKSLGYLSCLGNIKITRRTIMERNDIQKISSETANIPVYKQSAEYAIEHDELPIYRESFRVNMACRDALETAIHESYHDYCLDTGKASAQVAAQFGMERMAYVLANTVRAFDHDGRISRDNKAWAQTVPVCTDADEWGHERSRYFLVSQVNPGLVNLLVSRVREELAKEKDAPAKRPSVLEKIQKNKTMIQAKTEEKKLPGQER